MGHSRDGRIPIPLLVGLTTAVVFATVAVGEFITATLTDPDGNTVAFGQDKQPGPLGPGL